MDRKKLKSGRSTHRKVNANKENEQVQPLYMLARMPYVSWKEGCTEQSFKKEISGRSDLPVSSQ